MYGALDPAFDRSDHAELSSAGLCGLLRDTKLLQRSAADLASRRAEPNYHPPTDTFVDMEYAADIARVIASAAWRIANA